MSVLEHVVRSDDWKVYVRKYSSDKSDSICNLAPPQAHMLLQEVRVKYIAHDYWMKSYMEVFLNI